jgi:C1A family cysteine protease
MKRISLMLLLLPSFALASSVTTIDVKSLQAKLKKENVGWQADDTWLKKNGAIVKNMLGLRNPPQTDAQFEAPQSLRQSSQATVDWRNINGINYVSPILNQGNCGSCVAFATVATLETQMNIAYFGGLFRYSPQALFACGGGACEMGWFPSAAADYLQTSGVPDEACLPYTSGATGEDVECSASCRDSANRSLRIASYSSPTNYTKDLDSVKAALAHGPLLTTLTVYTDFLLYKSGVYKHTTGRAEGGHAISLVGYDDTKNAFIIRNSWGEDWGMNGFAYVSYDDISGVGHETYSLEVPKYNGYVTVRNPDNRTIVAGKMSAQAETTFGGLQKLEVNVVDAQNNKVATFDCGTQAKCAADFDTTKWADGKYEIFSTANLMTKSAEVSQRQYFFVSNAAPKLNLTFAPQKGDLSTPVKGRIVFNVRAESGVAPLSTVRLVAKQNGQEVYSRSTNIALPEMTLGWRTVSVPNGQYDVYLVGTQKVNNQTNTVESNHFTVNVNN